MVDHASLLARAREAAEHAYAPYSDFPVGAAVLSADGTIYTGCNVENASYGLTLCAERNATTTMIARLDPSDSVGRRIDTVAIVGLNAAPCWPCGACRQVLREFGCTTVVVEDDKGEPLSLNFDTLLPYSFGPEHLSKEA
ncbi:MULTISPECIES: cytidine deaminase [Corynebacterium]|uniref:cytidine deaminase n=1 Tax=Corynebacterium TaxID=1716 RepID=UPI00124CB8A6|nr:MULTISPECIES: cytidine deaminase [Corynebacterium]MBV7281974.1 cytidine deaminase [Corynebacterium sp. TAE3-ERU30]MBV7303121.1 cytidine deaminase [Corynebacterium sp. TAE3-ERU2]